MNVSYKFASSKDIHKFMFVCGVILIYQVVYAVGIFDPYTGADVFERPILDGSTIDSNLHIILYRHL